MPRIVVALQADFADWEPALLMAAARYYLGCEVLTASPDGAARRLDGRPQGRRPTSALPRSIRHASMRW